MKKPILPNGTKLDNGKYTIEDVLGEGTFGITYKAKGKYFEEYVAVKELFLVVDKYVCTRDGATVQPHFEPEQFTDFKNSFLKEAKKLKKLKQIDGVVDIEDYFEDNNTAYLVMSFIEGKTIKQLYSVDEDITLLDGSIVKINEVTKRQFAIETTIKILESLSRVHERKIIHRDINPNNIIIQKDTHIPYLVDFGISKELTEGIGEKNSRIVMTPAYSPPEQHFIDGVMDEQSDIYSVGATFYYLLTGKEPLSSSVYFQGKKSPFDEILVPTDLLPIVKKAMAATPAERFKSCEEFAQALKSDFVKPEPNPKPEPKPKPKPKKINISKQLLVFFVSAVVGAIAYYAFTHLDFSGNKEAVEKKRKEDSIRAVDSIAKIAVEDSINSLKLGYQKEFDSIKIKGEKTAYQDYITLHESDTSTFVKSFVDSAKTAIANIDGGCTKYNDEWVVDFRKKRGYNFIAKIFHDGLKLNITFIQFQKKSKNSDTLSSFQISSPILVDNNTIGFALKTSSINKTHTFDITAKYQVLGDDIYGTTPYYCNASDFYDSEADIVLIRKKHWGWCP